MLRQVAGPEAADWEVRQHVTVADVRGRIVIGVLPLVLAAEAALVVEIPLVLHPEDRGRELSLMEMRERVTGPAVAYTVTRVGEAPKMGAEEKEWLRAQQARGWVAA